MVLPYSMSEPRTGFTLMESARRLGQFRWLEGRCFALASSWVQAVPETPIKLAIARQAQHHALAEQMWLDRMPALSNVDPDGLTIPHDPRLVEFFDVALAHTAGEGTLGKLVALYAVVLPELAIVYQAHHEQASPHSDAAVRFSLEAVLWQISNDLKAGTNLLASFAGGADQLRVQRDDLVDALARAGGFAPSAFDPAAFASRFYQPPTVAP